MHKLVLLRHGESDWNRENRFTGWPDGDRSQKGIDEARAAGRLLKSGGYSFDIAFTSVLRRAIRTLWLALEKLDQMWIPVEKSWRLNERHYGALQGLDKAETAAKYGEAQVLAWRRSYDTRPPALAPDDPRGAAREARYAGLSAGESPLTHSPNDTGARGLPYWHGSIARPAARSSTSSTNRCGRSSTTTGATRTRWRAASPPSPRRARLGPDPQRPSSRARR